MAQKNKLRLTKWWHHLLVSLVCFALFFVIAVRAIDTGSLIEYSLGGVVIIYGFYELSKAIKKLRA